MSSTKECAIAKNKPAGLDIEPDPKVLRRFLAKVKRDEETGCWLWQGYCDSDGYAQFKFGGRAHWARRLAYAMFRRPMPGGLELDHKCRERSCVNPWHLDLVTKLENLASRYVGAEDDDTPF